MTIYEQAILEEIAEYDNRKALLWQLAADGRDFCGVEHTAQEMDYEDAPVEVQVQAFMQDLTNEDGEIREEYDEGTNWDALEDMYGNRADELLS